MTFRGSCLCREVGYEIAAPDGQAAHCHCSMCRKWSGAPLMTYAGFAKQGFRWTRGEALLARFASSEGIARVFCSRCGSNLAAWPSDPSPQAWVAMGTLDDDLGVKPSVHMFVGSKAPWFEITDGLPQREES